jgi:hypothetical protein
MFEHRKHVKNAISCADVRRIPPVMRTKKHCEHHTARKEVVRTAEDTATAEPDSTTESLCATCVRSAPPRHQAPGANPSCARRHCRARDVRACAQRQRVYRYTPSRTNLLARMSEVEPPPPVGRALGGIRLRELEEILVDVLDVRSAESPTACDAKPPMHPCAADARCHAAMREAHRALRQAHGRASTAIIIIIIIAANRRGPCAGCERDKATARDCSPRRAGPAGRRLHRVEVGRRLP